MQKKASTSLFTRLRPWLLGLVLLLGSIVVVTHLGELEAFVHLAQNAEPRWLLLALAFQLLTYVSVATVWHQALRYAGQYIHLRTLVLLGVAKLFTDQAMPSAGASGAGLLVAALRLRGVAPDLCLAVLLLSLIGYYSAYLLLSLASLALLWHYHAISPWVVILVGGFALVAVTITAGVLWLQSWARHRLAPFASRWPGFVRQLDELGQAPRYLVRNPRLLIQSTAFHGAVFVLDAATLWILLLGISLEVSFWIVLPSFMVASIVATLGPVPLGLGTFEASCVSMLSLLGTPLEAALTATILLRGLTLWLPMLPGLWLVRRVFAERGIPDDGK